MIGGVGWGWEQIIATLICPQVLSLAGTVTKSTSTKKYRIEHNIVTSLFVFILRLLSVVPCQITYKIVIKYKLKQNLLNYCN